MRVTGGGMSLRAASAPPRRRRSHIDDVLAAGIARLDLRPADVGMRVPSGSQRDRRARAPAPAPTPAPAPDLFAHETLDDDSDQEIQDGYLDLDELLKDKAFEELLKKDLGKPLADTDKREEQRSSERASNVKVDKLPFQNRHPRIVSWLTEHLDRTRYPAGPYPSSKEKEDMLQWYPDLNQRRLKDFLTTWRSRNGVARPVRLRFTEEQTAVLERWLRSNALYPFPKDDEKKELMKESGLTLTQLNDWFYNQRMRKFLLGDGAEGILNKWWMKWAPDARPTKPSNVEFAALKRDITKILPVVTAPEQRPQYLKYIETQIKAWLFNKRKQAP